MELELKLIEIGFSQNEAKVFLHLLHNKTATATEIADNCHFSRTLSYQILKHLIEQNICLEIRGNVRKFKLVNPQKIISKIEDTLNEKKKILDEISPKLSAIFNEKNKNNDPMDFIQVLYTKKSIVQKIELLEANATNIVYAFNRPPYAMNIDIMNTDQISDDFRDSQRRAMKKRVIFKSIYEEESNKAEFIRKVQYFQTMGEKIRISNKLPFKLMNFDEKIVAIALENNRAKDNKLVTLLIENQQFAEAITTIFDIFWTQSYTLDEYLKMNQD